MMLRIVVGYHFFKEGTNKLKDGDFTSRYFLAGAKGPFAHLFTSMVEDADGADRLCVVKTSEDGNSSIAVDPQAMTFPLWEDFCNKAFYHYQFGSEDVQKSLAKKRDALNAEIRKAHSSQQSNVDVNRLYAQRDQAQADIQAVALQPKQLEEILSNHKAQLSNWIKYNKVDLIGHFSTDERLSGFLRDGNNKQDAALYVDSLRGQVDSIRSDRTKKLAGWSKEVTTMWDSLELKINSLAVPVQLEGRESLAMHRHFDQEDSFYKVVDKFIPWFDTLIGVSLILGLFTWLSSLAAAGFLVSVILTQPPWIPGTTPTYFYFIELAALLVIFATAAGRLGGLDHFLSPSLYKSSAGTESNGNESNNPAQLEGHVA